MTSFTKDTTLVDHLASLMSSESSSTREHITQSFERQEEKQKAEKFHQIFLESLYFPEIYCRQEEIKDAHKETFKWIFDESGEKLRPWSNFVDWLEKGSGTYWINGKAGSGKSTLMNYILNQRETTEVLERWASGRKLLTSAVFFWTAGTPLQKSIQGFLRSLIFQLLDCQPELIPLATQQNKTCARPEIGSSIIWTEKKLLQCLKALARGASPSHRICFFIDGLDEFSRDIYGFIELIKELVQIPEIKCCFSSRPERIFEDFATPNVLMLQDLTHFDVQKYVESRLGQFSQIRNLPPEQAKKKLELKDIIVKKADGVFLWVELIVKSQITGIKNGDSLETLRKRLFSLPTEVEGLYSRMLTRIEPEYHKEAASFLQTARILQSRKCIDDYTDPSIFYFTVVRVGLTDTLRLTNDLSHSNIAPKCSNINHRIRTTCAGFLEVYANDKGRKFQKPYERWLSWEPNGFRSSSTGIDWTLRKVQFCHRTAKDFFEPDHEGGRFLSQHSTFLENESLLTAAIYLARIALCNLAHVDGYMWCLIFRLMYDVSLKNPQNPKDLALSVDLLNYFNYTIENLRRRYSSASDAIPWHRHWMLSLRLETRVKFGPRDGGFEAQFSHNLARDDFLSFAAFFGVYWYAREAFKKYDSNVDANRATQLALYTVATPRGLNSYGWKIYTWDAIDFLTRLNSLGANPNAGLSTSIWEEVLRFMYGVKLQGYFFTNLREFGDDRFAGVIRAFLEAGANPYPVIILDVDDIGLFPITSLDQLEIDVSQLPLIANGTSLGEDPCKIQEISERDRPMSSGRPRRIWFRKLRVYEVNSKDDGDESVQSSLTDMLYEEGCEMSDTEVQELNEILRIILDAPYHEKRKLGEKLRLWVKNMHEGFLLKVHQKNVKAIPEDSDEEKEEDGDNDKRGEET